MTDMPSMIPADDGLPYDMPYLVTEFLRDLEELRISVEPDPLDQEVCETCGSLYAARQHCDCGYIE